MNDSLKYYETHAEAYFNRVHGWDMKALYAIFLKHVSGRTILDLGCGTGRDARYFAEQGYGIIAVDGSKEMLAITQRECPTADCRLIDFRDDFRIGTSLDAIWACASLLHLDEANFERVLRIVLQDLKVGGAIYLGLKQAEHGDVPNDGRIFHYWSPERLRSVTSRCGLVPMEMRVEETPRITWINSVFQKA